MLVVHRAVAVLIVVLGLLGTIWAVHSWLGRGALSPRLLTLTVAMSAALGVQALVGIVLAVTGERPVDGATHFVVGPLALVALPLGRRVAATRSDRAGSAILAVAWFVLLLLALRPSEVAGG